MKKLLLTLALFTFFVNAHAQSLSQFDWKEVPPSEVGLSDSDIQNIKATVQSDIDNHTISGAVTAIVKNGKLVLYNAQGMADPIQNIPMTKDKIFSMMSSSKIIAGIAALQMIEEGKLGLEDPVSKYIPELSDMKVFVKEGETVPADKQITIRHLLTHTAGLMSTTNLGFVRNQIPSFDGDRLEDVIPRLSKATLDFQPGTQWSYSPIHGLDVIARVIEIVSGEPYNQYVKKHIFEPLGMTETWFTVPASERSRVVPIVKYENGKWVKQDKMFGEYGEKEATYFSASGGLYSTVHDYILLEVALLNGGILNGNRILSDASVKLMGSNLVGDLYSKFMPSRTDGFGFGITVSVADDDLKCHGLGKGAFSWNGAYGTDSWADPSNDIAAAYFMANPDGPREPVYHFQKTLSNAIKKVDSTKEVGSSDICITTLDYSVNSNGDTLRMDYFRAEGDTQKRPVIILSFGGGWAGGDRLVYREIAPRYVRHGINVAAIDYTLTLKGQKSLPDTTLFGAQYTNAIMTSVADLYNATRFLLDHKDDLGVREDKIIVSGGSAGATNSVMAEYWICNEAPIATSRLPKDFNYAGVIPAAGSIWKTGLEDPQWKKMPCPHMFMHGTADWTVPFWDTPIPSSNFKAFSPKNVADLLRARGAAVETFFVEEADHMMAAAPIFDFPYGGYTVDQTEHMLDFIDRVVLNGEKVQIDYYEKDYDVPRSFMVTLAGLLGNGENAAVVERKSEAYTLPQKGSGNIVSETVEYAVKSGESLKMDIYRDPSFTGKRPVFIYSFGGGWESGSRSDGSSDQYRFLQDLALHGYVAVGIDYRLGYLMARQKGIVPDESISNTIRKGALNDMKKGKALLSAIDMAVEDLYDATSYLVNNAEKWNIDPEKISIGGSSAGANNSISAELWRANGKTLAKKHLPKGFKYAGVVSMAGAWWHDAKDKCTFSSDLAPMFLIHGTDDTTVPYEYASWTSGVTVTGVSQISEKLESVKVPYMLFTEKGGDHFMSMYPMMDMHDLIFGFLDRMAVNGEVGAIKIEESGIEHSHDFYWYLTEKLGLPSDQAESTIKAILK